MMGIGPRPCGSGNCNGPFGMKIVYDCDRSGLGAEDDSQEHEGKPERKDEKREGTRERMRENERRGDKRRIAEVGPQKYL